MGFFDKRAEKKALQEMAKALQDEKQGYLDSAIRTYDSWSANTRFPEIAAEACYRIAMIAWKKDNLPNYNWAVQYMELAVEKGSKDAAAKLEELRKEAARDSLEQFPLWFNTMGYEVAEDYAKLADRCGAPEAKRMLRVLEYQRDPLREVAINTYNKGCIHVQQVDFDQTAFELFAKAAGMGLPEAMHNAVVTFYTFPYTEHPKTAFFPETSVCRSFADMGILRWSRKAALAGNKRAWDWWFGSEQGASLKHCYQHFSISERAEDLGLKWVPDVLPRLPVPGADYEWPEATYTYEKASAMTPE